MNLDGLHHVTAMAGDPQRNVDFYSGVLGLRLVKKTVNFDDPGCYHLYYGDHAGTPGTILTFFPWGGAPRGKPGAGQATRIAFQAARDSLAYWRERLAGRKVDGLQTSRRFDREYLAFHDPDGLALEVVETDRPVTIQPWTGADVPPEHALRGFDGVTLTLADLPPTDEILTQLLGGRFVGKDGEAVRYAIGEGPRAANIDLVLLASGWPGRGGAGTIHHLAWDTPSDEEQAAWLEKIARDGLNVSPVRDRNYFHSIYFREPGHVLFEIATTPPGFAVDEPVETLGEKLMLPSWLEPHRPELEKILPPLRPPARAS